jgi:hypothetical protein
MMGIEAQERFDVLLNRWRAAYRRILLIYLAYLTKGQWKLAYAAAFFQPDAVASVPPDIKVSTKSLVGGRLLLDCVKSDQHPMLQSLLKGELIIDGKHFTLGGGSADCTVNLFLDGPPNVPSQNVRTPTLVIRSNRTSGLANDLDLGEVDNDLRTSDTPFDGFEDLISSLALPADIRNSGSQRVEIFLGLAAVLALPDSRISDSQALIRVLAAPGIETSRVRVGLRFLDEKSNPRRLSLPGDQLTWNITDQWLEGTTRVPVGNAPYVQCLIQYGGEHVSRWWLTDPSRHLNFRTAIQRTFDPEDRKLAKLLFPPKTESRDLERGLALLLGVHGFGVLQYGEKESFQEGPDLVAISPRGRILVVECTVDLVDAHAKVTKLVNRTQRIVESLRRGSALNVEVLSVLVITVPRVDLVPHGELFKKTSVAVLAREDLDEALRRMNSPANPDGLYDDVRRLLESA